MKTFTRALWLVTSILIFRALTGCATLGPDTVAVAPEPQESIVINAGQAVDFLLLLNFLVP